MGFVGWMRLLNRNRFGVHWSRWHHAVFLTGASLFHTVYRWWQWPWVGWRANRAKIVDDPLFVIGHWRAGTTLLHELMVLDERHTSPTTYECLVPNHFLASEDFARRFLNFLLPAHRPMDNMAAGWDRPQEDEFALCNLGLPSPYLTIAFPNHGPVYEQYLTLEGVPEKDLDIWKRKLLRFLREISYRRPKRIVLKSPPHTCRVKTLLEIFPRARFIHIVRDPYVVYASTCNLWRTLYRKHGLQRPNFKGVEEYVLRTFERMYDKFESDRKLLEPDALCEVHYEELVRDPVGTIRSVYEKLDLGNFEQILPALEDYVANNEGYQTNKYEISDDERQQVAVRWSDFMRRYGYAPQPAEV